MTELSQRLSQDNEQDADHLEMRKHHITAWRYRVYIFVIFVVIVMIEPMFTASVDTLRWKDAFSISILDPVSMYTNRGIWGKLNELDDLQKTIEDTNNSIAVTKLQIEIVRNLETPEKQNTILNCVNRQQCDGIEVWLMDRLDLLRSFLMIDHLVSDKLDFDQKFVLRNINEFLATQIWRGQLVTIKDITFASPREVKPEYKLFEVPVTMTVTYFSNKDFMTFLHNIEAKISPELPVMWRIEAVNYDIIKYLEAQEVALSLKLYYINAPRPEPVLEPDLLVDAWTVDTRVIEWGNSEWIGTGEQIEEHTTAE